MTRCEPTGRGGRSPGLDDGRDRDRPSGLPPRLRRGQNVLFPCQHVNSALFFALRYHPKWSRAGCDASPPFRSNGRDRPYTAVFLHVGVRGCRPDACRRLLSFRPCEMPTAIRTRRRVLLRPLVRRVQRRLRWPRFLTWELSLLFPATTKINTEIVRSGASVATGEAILFSEVCTFGTVLRRRHYGAKITGKLIPCSGPNEGKSRFAFCRPRTGE